MADLLLPIDNSETEYTFDVLLSNQEYRFRIYFNNRLDTWFMDISETDSTRILSGLKLNANADLLKRFKKIKLPKGRIIGISTQNLPEDPTQATLGNNVVIIYEEP